MKPPLRDLTRTVAQPGYIEAYEQTAVYSQVTGFSKSFRVDLGQQVKKGDVLAEILVPERADMVGSSGPQRPMAER